jgi:hypothetical protein
MWLVICAMLAGTAPPALAQQTLNFSLGYFTVRGEDARVDGDVLSVNRTFLAFDVDDFNGPAVGAEWLVPLGNFVEAGAGLGFTRRTVDSVYDDFVDRDGTEIEQSLRLRTVPVEFTMRVLPLGQTSPLQPYFGGGLGIFSWRYSEFGEFIDFGNRNAVFQAQYVADGSETGPVGLAGIRFASGAFSTGGEIRYRGASADLDERFAGSKIDLGGWSYQFTVGVRFGR